MRVEKKRGATLQHDAIKSIRHHNSTNAQQQRLLSYLKSNTTVTTIEARELLDVMQPAARIFELKAQGYNIQTVWEVIPTAFGDTRRVGKYIYKGVRHDD